MDGVPLGTDMSPGPIIPPRAGTSLKPRQAFYQETGLSLECRRNQHNV